MSKRPARRAIPRPHHDLRSLVATAEATKEAVEILTGQTPDVYSSAVTLGQLRDLGLVTEQQIREYLGVSPRSV